MESQTNEQKKTCNRLWQASSLSMFTISKHLFKSCNIDPFVAEAKSS